ncbi:MAG: NAD(P)H-binding protein [Chloroflexota bacterium]
MILITGATGFIGRSLTRQLVESGQRVRILLRPSPRTPSLPTGVPVEVAVTSLADVRGLRAALRGVQAVYHLAGGEAEGGRANLQAVDIEGTRNLVEAARDAGVERIFYLSHLDADRASGFPVLKAKGIAEDFIRKSGVAYTILRGSILFGPDDAFTTGLAMLIALSPGLLPLPAKGESLVQPLWVEDLATCLTWALEEPKTVNQTYEVGGSEALTLRQVVAIIMEATRRPRLIIPWGIPSLRLMTMSLEAAFPRFPASVFWLDYLSVNRTCPVDAIPRVFGLMPARFASRLDYLRGVKWGCEAWKRLLTRQRER